MYKAIEVCGLENIMRVMVFSGVWGLERLHSGTEVENLMSSRGVGKCKGGIEITLFNN